MFAAAAKVAKAITAFLTVAAGILAAHPVTGGQDDTFTVVEALVLGAIAAGAVYAVPNKP